MRWSFKGGGGRGPPAPSLRKDSAMAHASCPPWPSSASPVSAMYEARLQPALGGIYGGEKPSGRHRRVSRVHVVGDRLIVGRRGVHLGVNGKMNMQLVFSFGSATNLKPGPDWAWTPHYRWPLTDLGSGDGGALPEVARIISGNVD